MNLRIRKLHPSARQPKYATTGAACFDLHSVESAFVGPEHHAVISTGLAFEIPNDHVMLIFSRSGHGFRQGIRLANCTGVIDSDYRGEVMIKLQSDSDQHELNIDPGDRIAQALILQVQQVTFEWADTLSDTDRGEGGFGSTGA